jgi:hypothetical protein
MECVSTTEQIPLFLSIVIRNILGSLTMITQSSTTKNLVMRISILAFIALSQNLELKQNCQMG